MPSHEHGTFINGFHETWPMVHAEEAYRLASVGQSIATLPDATAITLYVDDEPMLLAHGRLLDHQRRLDLRRGVLERDLEWESPSGVQVRVHSERLVSFAQRHLAAFRFEGTVKRWSCSMLGALPAAPLVVAGSGTSRRRHPSITRSSCTITPSSSTGFRC